MAIEGMQTPEEIVEIFDTPRAFKNEDAVGTMTRFEWLATRQRAEFLLVLAHVGLEQETLLDLIGAFEYAQADFRDFMVVGLELQSCKEYLPIHPCAEAIDDLVDGIEDTLDGKRDVAILEDMIKGNGQIFESLGAEPEDEIIHHLEVLAQKYSA